MDKKITRKQIFKIAIHIPCNRIYMTFQLFRVISPCKRPANITCGITYMSTWYGSKYWSLENTKDKSCITNLILKSLRPKRWMDSKLAKKQWRSLLYSFHAIDSFHLAAWNWGWDCKWSYYTEYWTPRWKFFTNCCTKRGFRLHIIIKDSISNSKKRLVHVFHVFHVIKVYYTKPY